jgi:tetratricopeptide (TPR) repeat protein
MFKLKPLPKESIAAALQQAERYRLLNEALEAESICRDVIAIDPENQRALITLILALTDRFSEELGEWLSEASSLLSRLTEEYARAYYAGIICERQGKALIAHGTLGAGPVAYEEFRKAMNWYEKAEKIRPPGNDDAILRWNTCARLLMRHKHLRPPPGPPLRDSSSYDME